MVYTHNFLEILLVKSTKKEKNEDAKNENSSEDGLGQKTTNLVSWAVLIKNFLHHLKMLIWVGVHGFGVTKLF